MKAIGIYWEGNQKISAGIKKSRKEFFVEFSPENRRDLLVGGLSTHEVITRAFTLPLTSKRRALQLLPFQLEAIFPVPLEEVISIPLFKKKEGLEITVCACLKKSLENYLLNADPDVISTVPRALQAFVSAYFPEAPDGVVIHLEEGRTHVVQIGGILSSSFEKGARDLLGEEGRKKFLSELDRSLFFISQTAKPYRLIATGHFSHHRSILSEIEARFERTPSMFIVEDEKLSTHAIPVGLALEALSEEGIQMRQGNYAKRSFGRRLWRKAAFKAGIVCIVGILACAWVFAEIGQRKRTLMDGVNSALEESGSSSRLNPRDSLETIELKLEKIKRGFQRSQSAFRFYEKPKRWIDFFTWLRQVDPKLVTGESQIRKIRYALEKYPTLTSPYTPYQVYMELEVKTADREGLKKKLMDPKGVVDLSLPSAFEELEDGFRATFYLRAP